MDEKRGASFVLNASGSRRTQLCLSFRPAKCQKQFVLTCA